MFASQLFDQGKEFRWVQKFPKNDSLDVIADVDVKVRICGIANLGGTGGVAYIVEILDEKPKRYTHAIAEQVYLCPLDAK